MGNAPSTRVEHSLVRYENRMIEEHTEDILIVLQPLSTSSNGEKKVVFYTDPAGTTGGRYNPFTSIREKHLDDRSKTKAVLLSISVQHVRNDFDKVIDLQLCDVIDQPQEDWKNNEDILAPSRLPIRCPANHNGKVSQALRSLYDIHDVIAENILKAYVGQEDIIYGDGSHNNVAPEDDQNISQLYDEDHPMMLLINDYKHELSTNVAEDVQQITTEGQDKKCIYRVKQGLVNRSREMATEIAFKNILYTSFKDTQLMMIQNEALIDYLNKIHHQRCTRAVGFRPVLAITLRVRHLVVTPGRLHRASLVKHKERLIMNDNDNSY